MDLFEHDGSVQKPKVSTCVFETINERLEGGSSSVWNGQTIQETPIIDTFTTSIYLAAPPPSHIMKTATKQFTISPLCPALSDARSLAKPTEISLLYSSPLKESDSDYAHFDGPARSLTSSFYMSTGAPTQETKFKVIPLARNSSSRIRYNSTGSVSPSSTDSGTVSFDFSLPSQTNILIDSVNISPETEEKSTEMIFDDSGYNSHRSEMENATNQVASVFKIDLNYNQPESSVINPSVNQSQPSIVRQSRANLFNQSERIFPKSDCPNQSNMVYVNSSLRSDQSEMSSSNQPKTLYRKQFDKLNRRASFEIHSTDTGTENNLVNKEKPFVRRHSLYVDQSALSQGKFSIDDDISMNKYRDYTENVLVDLLKKCTDFPERRRIRSALRYIRENIKVPENPKCERSTFFIPFQDSTNVNPSSVSMATVKLSPRDVNQGQITPVLTSTPRDIELFALNDVGEFSSSEHTEPDQSYEDKACESHYHFEIPSANIVTEFSHFEFSDSDEDKSPRTTTSKSQSAKSKATTTTSAKKPSSQSSVRVQTVSSQSSRVLNKSSGTSSEAPASRTTKSAVSNSLASTTASKETVKSTLGSGKLRPKSGGKPKETVAVSRKPLPNKESVVCKKVPSTQQTALSNVLKKSSDVKLTTRSEVRSPRRKLPDTQTKDTTSQFSTSSRVSSRSSSTQSAKTSSGLRTNSKTETKNNRLATSSKKEIIKDSGTVIVKTPTENIVIPKIVISDEHDPIINESFNSDDSSLGSKIADYTKDNDSKEKRKYYRKKLCPASPTVVNSDTELSKMSTAVARDTRSEVINSDGPMKIDLENNNNKTESSPGETDLEKAFNDLLDNFDKNLQTDDTKGLNQTDMNDTNPIVSKIESSGVDIMPENNNTVSRDLNNLTEDNVNVEVISTTPDSSDVSERTGGENTMKKGADDRDLASLDAIEEEAFDIDRLGDVKVEESDDGTLTVTDVEQFDKGQRKVSVTTTKKRTDSEAEYQDKETTIVTTFESPSGTKYEEQDVIKTRRKLTPKGSIYIKKDTVRKKRALSSTGEQTVEEDHVVETENKSVSQGRSWGDKTLTTTVLNKPTKADRAIHSIQEETTLVGQNKEKEETKIDERSGIPDILQALADQHVMVGTSATLQCEGKSIPAPEVTWYSGDSVVTETAYFKPSFNGTKATLTITEVFPDDEGIFRCVFKNVHGSAQTRCKLRVSAPRLEDVPSIREALDDLEVAPGDSVTFKCRFRGAGDIIWHKEGTRMKESGRLKIKVHSGTAELTIKEVKPDDAGQYSCSVKNSAGEASTICQLMVTEVGCPPDILNPLFNCVATVGKPFKMLCRISGDPPPSVKWLHNGRQLYETSSCKPSYIENIARFELKSVAASDQGSYECVGTNSLGSASTSCELDVKEETSSTKATLQLNMSSVAKRVDNADNSDLTDGVRRLEASQSLDMPISQSNSSAKDLDFYSRGTVRSCTPPPQVRSCSPPKSLEIQSCSPQSAKVFNPNSPSSVPRENGGRSRALTRSQSLKVNGEMEKTSAVNRLQNFFGNIMNNNNSSPNSFARSPSEEQQIETKSSFVVKKRDNISNRSSGISLDLSPTQVVGGKQSGDDSFGDLSTIHRDIIMSAKIQEIDDEETLHKLMNTTDNFEERKMIRARLKQLREKAKEDWERGRREREAASVDVVKLKHQRAEEDKKRKMAAFQTRAETAGEDKYLVQTQKDLTDRQKFADDEKQKKLDAYNQIAKTGSGVSESRTTTSRQTTTDNDGKSTTTTTTKTVTLQQQGFGGSSYGTPAPKADDVSLNIANQLSSPYTSGKITVRTESWNSQEGVVKKSETTQRWGANKSPGPRGAMAAFKQMDTLNPTAPAKPNAFLSVSLAKKAATTMRRNVVQIKAEILDFCKSNTAEYKNVSVTNFSSCWNNGMAFCALIHHFYPDSFDFNSLDPKKRRKNFELAFDTAEKEADIAPLLDVEDMVKMKNPDWKCVFTYVQSFYRHLRNHPNCKQIVPPSQ